MHDDEGKDDKGRRGASNVRIALMLGAIALLLYLSFILKNA